MRAASNRFFPAMFSVALAALAVVFLSGCAFYQLREHPKTELSNQPDKTVILHFKGIQINLTHVQLTKTDLSGIVSKAFIESNEPDNSIHSREQALEAHIYLDSLNANSLIKGTPLRIPLGNINSLKLYDVNKGRTIMTYALIGVGIASFGLIAILINDLANSVGGNSCPFVYTSDSDTDRFAGEIFAGAVYPQLERHDYLPLPSLQPVNGTYLPR